MDYWKECIAEAFESAKIVATDEQINEVASWAEGAHENYGMAHGHDCIPNPETLRADELKRKLEIEQRKIYCKECKGSGRIYSQGPYHGSDSQCWKCNGEGKYLP